ncbi:hypothetical protein GCM10027275_05370 [Rhabdobacter roseus]|uniref:Uncharacterized protein n=1 Tax=Rhabdobacter roseus TaxID=1655419 RepID=A0A840TR06_9BACT|nr:hypothetical protein [Rhabdobacter roseus]MBB5282428.1 hypothetical protein [Rhabdobacter roseus]
MEELLTKYRELSQIHRQQLLAFMDNLLLEQKLEESKGDLSGWKRKIRDVSVWDEEEIEKMKATIKQYGQWQAPKW